jgi:hypothetical protein
MSIYEVGIQDALSLSDSAVAYAFRSLAISDSLGLTEGAYVNFGIQDELSLSDSAVAYAFRPLAISDSLSLTEEAYVNFAVTSELSLSDEAYVNFAVTSALSLSDEAYVNFTVTSALSLSDEAYVNFTVTSALSLSDSAVAYVFRLVASSDSLSLSDSAGASMVRLLAAADVLAAVHQNFDPVTWELTDYIVGLQDSAKVTPGCLWNAGAVDALVLGHRARRGLVRVDAVAAEATSTLVLIDTAYRNETAAGTDALTIVQTAVVVATKLLEDALTLTDEATVQTVLNLAATDSLSLVQYVGFTVPAPNLENVYTPFVGAGATLAPATILDGPVAGIGSCRLLDLTNPLTCIVLRSPEFGNKDRLQFNRISRETRGGTLVVYADPVWAKVQTLVLSFSLTRIQALGLLEFMTDHLGQEVGFVDWEGRYWVGVIVNPTDPVVQDGKNQFTASFEFEGERAEWS